MLCSRKKQNWLYIYSIGSYEKPIMAIFLDIVSFRNRCRNEKKKSKWTMILAYNLTKAFYRLQIYETITLVEEWHY